VRVEEAETLLAAQLVQAGISPEATNIGATEVRNAWEAFCLFARSPMNDPRLPPDVPHGDGLLFESGVYDWGDGPSFQFGLVRQFSLLVGGEYDHMEQLRLVFHYDPTPELESLPRGELWSFDLSLDEWISRVEAEPGFRAAVQPGRVASRIEILQEEV
jgi:hypothetical protein